MSKATAILFVAEADYIAETLRAADAGQLETWPAGTADTTTIALTDSQVRYLEGLASDSDGHVDSDGELWIGGTPNPLTVVHNA
jgi:hypothetical protein